MQAPITETLSFSALRQTLRERFSRLKRQEARYVITRGGKPVAAVVSVEDLQRLQFLDHLIARDLATLEAFREGFKDIPEDELMREADAAVAEIRAERRAARLAAAAALEAESVTTSMSS